jgi:hypothetical protein
MQLQQLEEHCAVIINSMLDKGLITPNCEFWIRPHGENLIFIWYRLEANTEHTRITFYGAGVEAFDKAHKWLQSLPTLAERLQQEHLRKVADVVDFGRRHQIDGELLNPLEAQLKALSVNILADQSPPPQPLHPAVEADEIPY